MLLAGELVSWLYRLLSLGVQCMIVSLHPGSHDTHIFRLKEPVSQKTINTLDYPVNLQQAENGQCLRLARMV